MYQNDRSKLHSAAQLKRSVRRARRLAARGSIRSSTTKPIAASSPAPVMAAPSHSGGCQPASYSERAQVGDLSREYEPTRARLRNRAAARAMPLRENHCAMPATREMKIAPSLMPNTKRPAHISS